MLCKLSELVLELKKRFPTTTTRLFTGSVRGVARLPAGSGAALDEQTLYVTTPDALAAWEGEGESVPILCVADPLADVDAVLPQRCVILVRSGSMSDVLLALPGILFDLGQRTSRLGELTGRLLRCRTLADLAAETSALAGNPVVITDALLGTVEYTRVTDAQVLERWMDFVRVGRLSIDNAAAGADVDGAMEAGGPVVRVPAGRAHPELIQKVLIARGRFIGYLLLPALCGPLTDAAQEVCDAAGNLAAILMLEQRSEAPEAGVLEAWLESLLESGGSSREEIGRRLEQLGWRPKPHLYVLLLSNNGQLMGMAIRQTIASVGRSLPGCRGICHKNGLLFLWESDTLLTQGDSRLENLVSLLEGCGCKAGFSRPFAQVSALREAYFQARKALELGDKLEPRRRICTYERYSVYHMLELSSSYKSLEDFQFPGYDALTDYDRDNAAQLEKTLQVYLKHGGSMSKTAAELYIHMNTARYRMSLVSKLLQADLADGETLFQLSLTQRIRLLLANDQPHEATAHRPGGDGQTRKEASYDGTQ